jgi:hypothetical protein
MNSRYRSVAFAERYCVSTVMSVDCVQPAALISRLRSTRSLFTWSTNAAASTFGAGAGVGSFDPEQPASAQATAAAVRPAAT